MSLEFNPNKPAPTYEWATYIPDRTTGPKFKPHQTRAHCLSAIKGREGIAYKWNGDEWREVYRCEKPIYADNCFVCGKSLVREGKKYDWITKEHVPYFYKAGQFEWINKENEFPTQVSLCYGYECRKALK